MKKWLKRLIIGVGIFAILFVGTGLTWKYFSDIEYKKNWVERAMNSDEAPTISDDRADRFAWQTLNAFFDEGKNMEEHISYLGEKWGLSDVDKLEVLRRALDMIDEATSDLK